MKAGVKTTEFWATLLTMFLGFLNTMGVLPSEFPVDESTSLIVSGAVVVAYVLGRSWAKGKANGTTPPA